MRDIDERIKKHLAVVQKNMVTELFSSLLLDP